MVVPSSKIVSAWLCGSRTHDEGLHPIDPPPAAKKKRLAPISLRASYSQRDIIKAKAAEAGLSVNRFLLQLACDPHLPVKPSKADRAERAAVLRAYRGTGTLLNQIARHLNSGRIVGALDIADIIKRHEENAKLLLAALIGGKP